jgi:hypothetical protein
MPTPLKILLRLYEAWRISDQDLVDARKSVSKT